MKCQGCGNNEGSICSPDGSIGFIYCRKCEKEILNNPFDPHHRYIKEHADNEKAEWARFKEESDKKRAEWLKNARTCEKCGEKHDCNASICGKCFMESRK
jgi:hypothetical protein